MTRSAIGTEEKRTSISDGAAARAKNASDEADHIAVARVSKPNGAQD